MKKRTIFVIVIYFIGATSLETAALEDTALSDGAQQYRLRYGYSPVVFTVTVDDPNPGSQSYQYEDEI